jgi:hypothetical protein
MTDQPPPFFLPSEILTEKLDQTAAWHAIVSFNRYRNDASRVWRLAFRHNGTDHLAQVGLPVPAYYREPGPVVAIVDGGSCWHIISLTRGFARGEPIYAGKGWPTTATPFAE